MAAIEGGGVCPVCSARGAVGIGREGHRTMGGFKGQKSLEPLHLLRRSRAAKLRRNNQLA